MTNTYDVVVVGAGPSGSTAALHLARAGLKTLLLEKERIPRYKPCGGGVTAKVRGLIDVDFAPAVEDTIAQISVADRTERMRIASAAGWCVMRERFDALLAEHAARCGAELRDAEPVKAMALDGEGVAVSTRSETVRARVVVGADGVNGIVRRAVGFPAHTRMGVALEAEMAATPAGMDEWRGALHLDFGAIAWGYAWIFPKADHLSVGIGALMRRGQALDLRAELARYVASEPSLRGAQELVRRGHRIPMGGRVARYHAPRAVLVGDAAGLVDPFTAEGIYYAVRSGRIAADEIAHAFHRGDLNLAPYTRRINAEINADFRYAWLMTQVIGRWPHVVYDAFTHSASMQRSAGNLLSGDTTYRALIHGFAKKLGRTLLS